MLRTIAAYSFGALTILSIVAMLVLNLVAMATNNVDMFAYALLVGCVACVSMVATTSVAG